MKRNIFALGSASILILAGVTLAAPAMAQDQSQNQGQTQGAMQNQPQADQSQAQDQSPAKARPMHRHRVSQTARVERKEDRQEDRVTAQLNQQQLAQAGNSNGSMSNATMTNEQNAAPTNTGYTAQPNSAQQGAQRPDDNPQTNNCVVAGSGVNCSTPTPNSNGASPGPSK